MENTNKTNPKLDVVVEDVVKGVAERVDVEESVELERSERPDGNEVEWEKGSLLDYDVRVEEEPNSRGSSPIPGPDDFDNEQMDEDFADFGGHRYAKRRYSDRFDFDYMPLSDPEEEVTAPPKVSTARRGKVRSTMHTWGLAEAQKEYEELMAKNKAQMEKEEAESGRVLRSHTKGKGKGKGKTQEGGKKKTAEEFDHFLADATRFAEECLEESRKNPPPVSKEVCEAVEKEMRRRKEIEREVDRELESSVNPEPVAGSSQFPAPSIAGTVESLIEMDLGDLDDRPVDDLKAIAAKKLTTVMTVATKSGNLQGRYVRDLKDAAKSLREVIECLAVRPDGEELRRLKTANYNLRRELEEVRRDMKELRQELRDRRPSSPPPPPVPQASAPVLPPALRDFNPDDFLEKVQRMVAVTCGTIITARIEALGLPPPPIVRPPLAADINRTTVPGVSIPPAVANEPQETWATVTRKGKKGKGKKTVAPSAVAVVAAPAAISGAASSAILGGTNSAGLPGVATSAPPASSAVTSAPKPVTRPKQRLVAPRSSAVVVTLEPEAVARGVTYKDALMEARRSITLEELTVERVSTRQTATGARIIELFGPDSATKADSLAAKMREKLSGLAKITRPIKCTDIRIVGLDDTVEKDEIVAVLVDKSGCCADQIKMGEVRPGPRGGSVVVSIPTTGAKKLSDAGRLLIGWSSVQVQTLDPRPLRCFRCMGVGHTRQLCPSPYDRSDLCFRCGIYGHKAAGCFLEARCAVCEDANRPFRHTMGGRDCNPPPIKGKTVPPVVPGAAVPHIQHQDEERDMSVQNSDRDSDSLEE